MSIHQEATFPISPERIYNLLTNGAEFASATGRPAEIGTRAGESFSIFGGYISGTQIELVPGQRVVQSWRGMDWKPGVYSTVQFPLKPEDTSLIVDHDGYPGGRKPK